MFSYYALTCIWPSNLDFTITSIAKCLRDLENYNGNMSGHVGRLLENDAHPLFHQVLDPLSFIAQTLRSNSSHDFRGPHYAAWRAQVSTLHEDSSTSSEVDRFFGSTASRT
jgi:hypothetical protein